MALPLTITVRITVTGHGCHGYRCFGAASEVDLGPLAIGPDVLVQGHGTSKTLGERCHDLLRVACDGVSRNAWADRGQDDVGRHLGGVLLGGLSKDQEETLRRAKEVRIEVVVPLGPGTDHLLRIPWPTLVWEGEPRCRTGWVVMLRVETAPNDRVVDFPAAPRLLVVTPRVAQGGQALPTHQHLKELRDALAGPTGVALGRERWREVHTWKAFTVEVGEFKPDALYFFGHGTLGPGSVPKLVFDAERGGSEERTVSDLAMAMGGGQGRIPMKVAYLNCCFGGEGDHLGVGVQLASRVSAVVTNRTAADPTIAGNQAVRFWRELFHGKTPEQAMGAVYQGLGPGETSGLPIWFTPVSYKNYRKWNPLGATESVAHQGWRADLDRIAQFNAVITGCQDVMKSGSRLKGLAFVWHGNSEACLPLFHERLARRLAEKIGHDAIVENRPMALPGPFHARDREVCLRPDAYFQTPLVRALVGEQVPWADCRVRLRDRLGSWGRPAWVYLSLLPTPGETLPPALLAGFLAWWDKELPKLLDADMHCVLGVAYEVADAEARAALEAELEKHEVSGRRIHTATTLLPALDKVALQELKQFFEEKRDRPLTGPEREYCRRIHEETGGVYQKLIEQLTSDGVFDSDNP